METRFDERTRARLASMGEDHGYYADGHEIDGEAWIGLYDFDHSLAGEGYGCSPDTAFVAALADAEI